MRNYTAPSDIAELHGDLAPSEYTHMLIYNFPNILITKKAKNQRFLPIHQIKGVKAEDLYRRILKFHRFSLLQYRIYRRHIFYDIFYFRIVPRNELIDDRRYNSGMVACNLDGMNRCDFSPDDFILQIGYLGEDDKFTSSFMHGEEAKALYSKLTGCDEPFTLPKQEGKPSTIYDDMRQMDWFDIA